MAVKSSTEQYGANLYEDEYQLEERPQWLSQFSQEDFAILAQGRRDIMARIGLECRIAEATMEFRDETEVEDGHLMTEAELSIYQITISAGRTATEFVDEVIGLHHDPNSPLHIDQTGHHWSEDSMEKWRDNRIIDLQYFTIQQMREGHTTQYGFAIMTRQAIEQIHETVGDTPIVEIGAGNGWLAHEMNEHGLTVFPTDPVQIKRNKYAVGEEHMPVERLDGREALQKYPDASMMWSWPEMSAYVRNVMTAFHGKHLIYIGENGDGCTGPQEDIVVTMEGRYREAGHIYIPSFPSVNDNVNILERIDYDILPPEQNAPIYQTPWDQHLRRDDLDDILRNDIRPDLAERIAEAAWEEDRIPGGMDETKEETLRRNLGFSIPHIARATISDAMQHGTPELRGQLQEAIQGSEDDWAEARVVDIIRLAEASTERIIEMEKAIWSRDE